MVGTPARANSSMRTTCSRFESPAPPYSLGHDTPSNRLLTSFARQDSTKRSASARSSIAPIPRQPDGRCSARNVRTRWRKRSASPKGRLALFEKGADAFSPVRAVEELRDDLSLQGNRGREVHFKPAMHEPLRRGQ